MFMNMKKAKLLAYGMAFCFLLIHILLVNIFLQCDATPLVYFNFFSICFYIFSLYVVHKEWLPFYAVSVYLEVVAHMTFAVILTGWNSGFQITIIGMNVLAFYAEYTGRNLKVKYIPMMPLGIGGMLLYISSYIYLHFNPAPYALPANAEFRLSILWGAIVFIINLFVLQLLVHIANSSEEKLAYQLSHDKLTNLPNRYYLSEELENIKKEKSDYWLAISDIDNFKKINDTYGHNCGDYVLKIIGEFLAKTDVLCCRWGGEEFIFLGKMTINHAEPHDFLEGIRKQIDQYPFEYEGTKIHVTMTFGLSTFSSDQDIDKVISDADQKLYIGKSQGKNRIVSVRKDYDSKLLANQDTLTRVKNRSAYEKMLESLNLDIQNHTAQFGIVRIDLLNTEEIRQKYGQDRENEYIIAACKVICDVFMNSQVFRTQKDNFSVLLTNQDYYDREELFATMEEKFNISAQNKKLAPWQRFKTESGMAIYSDQDKSLSDLFKRINQ